MRSFQLYPAALLLLLALLTACGTAESEDTTGSEWTIEEEDIQLEEDLMVSDREDFYFGNVGGVAVTEDGRMLVADGREHHVKVLSPEGELLETIGQEGEGPGEFQVLSSLALARGDSLFVLDQRQRRVSVFGPDHQFAYAIPVSHESGSPSEMLVPEDEGLIMIFTPAFRPGDDHEEQRTSVRPVSADGTVGDELLQTRRSRFFIDGREGAMVVMSLPFGRGPRFALGPESHLHTGWTDSLRVTAYTLAGEPVDTTDIPFEHVPVTSEERDRRAEQYPESGWDLLRDSIPDTKPAFSTLLVDDAGRYWFERASEDPEQSDWWIADPETNQVATLSLPSDVKLRVVKDGYAYARATDEQGAPALVRYRIAE